MNSAHNQKLNPDKPPSFEDVSKLFSLPLSEAADILGVSASLLKKLCNDNGLERWPHRKYLAGKSIEDIKDEATKEKSKALVGTPQADRQKGNVTTGLVFSSQGSVVKDKNPRSVPDVSRSTSNAQQPGSRSILTWRSQQSLVSGLTIGTSTCLDEFKYGFPSSGLSRSTNKWWCRASSEHDNVSKHNLKTGSEVRDASEAEMNNNTATLCVEKPDSMMEDSTRDIEDKVSISEDTTRDMKDKVSLSVIRKRAVDEGLNALKLGASKKYGVDKLGHDDKILLHRLFQTS